MKTQFETGLHKPVWKKCIYAALSAATIPLLFLPACDYSLRPEVPAIVVRQDSPAHAVSQAQAAPVCPPINFQTAQQISDSNPEFFGLRRQPDGSFTELTYTADSAITTVTQTGSVAHAEQALINCAGISSRTRKVVAPGLILMPLGTPSSSPIGVDLAGDGNGSLVGLFEAHYANQVVVQRVGTAESPVSKTVPYAVGTSPAGVVAGDFNGDGKKDIAVAYTGASPTSSGPGGVSILLGNGDGTLKPAVNNPTGNNALALTAFDFNGDGRTDLAVGYYGGLVQIQLANADGSLRMAAQFAMPSGEYSVDSLAAADMNGDHIADLLVLTDTKVHIFYGKGDGTFTTGPVLAAGNGYGWLGTGDFNLDGITDFVVSSPQVGGVLVYMGTGGGNFAAPVGYATVFGAYDAGTGNFFVEDFDGDGFPDLVFGSGHPDAVTTDVQGDPIAVLFGNGDGTFAGGPVLKIDSDTVYSQTPATAGIVAADLNGDGKPDIAAASANGKNITVALGTGKGLFKAPATISLGTVQPTSIAAGALTSDGKPDLVVTDGVSNIYVLYHNGDGTFQQPVRYPTGGSNPSFVVTGDFNGDKKLDVAVANSGSNTVAILPGFGDSSFNNPIATTVGTNPVAVVAGDFNGDGKLDLAVANGGTFSSAGTNLGSVSVLLGKGDGTFQPAVNYAAYQYPTFLTAADVNGDGKLDLIVASRGANGTDEIAVLAGTGTGTFQNAVLTPTSSGPVWITAADFSGDGRIDLAVSHCCNTTAMSTMVGNGDGTFQSEAQLGQGTFFTSASADFDGDGKPDLAFTSYVAAWGRVAMVYRNISVSRGTLSIYNAAGSPLKAPPLASGSIATVFGSDLAAGTPPSATLTVQDSTGASQQSTLFYVSPTQVNFLIPPSTASGNATLTVTSADGHVSVGTVAIVGVAPAFFTLGNGVAAAYVQRVHGDLSQSIENIYGVDASGNLTFPPIDLGPSSDQVYLNIFGTGIQGRSALTAVKITVGGVSVTPLYAGPSGFPGEDQVAILLPRSLMGAGTVNIVMTVDGLAANTVTLNIK